VGLLLIPIWLPVLIANAALYNWNEKRKHFGHTTPDRDCLYCQPHMRMVEGRHWFNDGVPIKKRDSQEVG
jgi:hypothetical protein